MSGPISVVIAEDSLLVRDSVHRALSTDADVNVVGIAEDYDSAVELIEKHHPTLLFTDVRMPPTSTDEGIRLARWMRTAHPDIGVIVLSQYADPHYVTGLLDGGTGPFAYIVDRLRVGIVFAPIHGQVFLCTDPLGNKACFKKSARGNKH